MDNDKNEPVHLVEDTEIDDGLLALKMESTGVYNCLFDDGQHWRVQLSEIMRFRNIWLERMTAIRPFSERISRCFWFDLLILTRRYRIEPEDILQSILHVENGEPASGLKPATQFTRQPLRGLWHKHWFSARFMPANLLASMNRPGSMDFIWEIAKEGDLLTEEIVNQIAHHVTMTAYEERFAAKKMTGEWIIFLKHNGLNYYLCLGTHLTGDQRILDKITSICSLDFPELPNWLADAIK
jgi:hypothetical protein